MKQITATAFALAAIMGVFVHSGASAQTVSSTVVNNKGESIGGATFRGGSNGVVTRLVLQPGALSPGWHGLHFHAVGDCSDNAKFENAKAHVNHGAKKHGLLNSDGPDNGDLPNIYAAPDGSVNAEVSSQLVKLSGSPEALTDGDGSALIIHANEDDHSSQPIGNAGARLGCAVIK